MAYLLRIDIPVLARKIRSDPESVFQPNEKREWVGPNQHADLINRKRR